MKSSTKQILAVVAPAILIAGGELAFLMSREAKAPAVPVRQTSNLNAAAATPPPAQLNPAPAVRRAEIVPVTEEAAPSIDSGVPVTTEAPQAPSVETPVAVVTHSPAPVAAVPTQAPAPVPVAATPAPAPKVIPPPVRNTLPPQITPQVAGGGQNSSGGGSTAVVPVSHSISAYDNVDRPAPVPAPPSGNSKPHAVITPQSSVMKSASAPVQASSAAASNRVVAAHFLRPTIRDGDANTLILTAAGNVTSFSAELSNPSGMAILPFSGNTSGADQLSGVITVPAHGERGVWFVKSLTLTGPAGAEIFSYSAANSPATMTVASLSNDATPPKLVRIDTRMTMKGLTLKFAVSDDTGVGSVTGVFDSPSGKNHIPFSAKQTDIAWEYTEPFEVTECGEWVVGEVVVTDRAGNRTLVRRDDPRVEPLKFDIVKCGDATPK